jgi:hypothetical protein
MLVRRFIAVTYTGEKQFKGRKDGSGLWFQKCQYITAGKVWWSRAAYLMAARKQRERERDRDRERETERENACTAGLSSF